MPALNLICVVASFVAIASAADGFAPSAPATDAKFEKLTMPDGLVVNVDPVKASGALAFTLSNGTPRRSLLSLRFENFSGTTTRVSPHGVTLEPLFPTGSGNKEFAPESVEPNSAQPVSVQVKGLVEPGEFSATLFNGPVPLGRIQVVGFPFKVHPDVPTGTPMSIAIGPSSVEFVIKNDDPYAYRIRWELLVGQQVFRGDDVWIQANSSTIVKGCVNGVTAGCPAIALAGLWESFCYRVRDKTDAGELRITYLGENVPSEFSPALLFPVKATIKLHSSEEVTLLGSLILVLVLTLGAIASICANLWIPHNLRKNALQSRLGLVLRRIQELSSSLPSRARVSAEVDCLQLSGRLKDEGAFYSDFDQILEDYESHVTALEARTQLIAEVDECQRVLDQITSMTVPPSFITRAKQPFDQLICMFESGDWTEAQFQAASTLLNDLKVRVANVQNVVIDADFRTEVRLALVHSQSVFSVPRTGTAARFELLMPGVFRTLDSLPSDKAVLTPEDWANLDFTRWKLEMIGRFAAAIDGSGSKAWRSRLEQKAGFAEPVPAGSLVYFLELNAWDALNCAELLCAEVDQGIFREDICAAIEHGQVVVQPLQKHITSERRVDAEISFFNYAYNHAAARREITPRWTFTPRVPRRFWDRVFTTLKWRSNLGEPRYEDGWGVSCLVRPYRCVETHVCFEDWFGEIKYSGENGGINVTYPIETNSTGLVLPRLIMEISKLALGLAIPILGLLAGAREKLLSMDVSAALATVFVLGFGADSIKNALTRGTVSSPGPTPPKTPPISPPVNAPVKFAAAQAIGSI